MKSTLAVVCCIFFGLGGISAQDIPNFLKAITFDKARKIDENSWEKLRSFEKPIVVRVVFDENVKPECYVENIRKLHDLRFEGPNGGRKVFIVGELLDSVGLRTYLWNSSPIADTDTCSNKKDSKAPKFHSFKDRVDTYAASELISLVDIWEIGNEVNGEWADEGCIPDGDPDDKKCKKLRISEKMKTSEKVKTSKKVKTSENDKRFSSPLPVNTVAKIDYAISSFAAKGKSVALTVIHQPDCLNWDSPKYSNDMFRWVREWLLLHLKAKKVDYLFISYYEDECNSGTKPESGDCFKEGNQTLPGWQEAYWNCIFGKLADAFDAKGISVSWIGFGEVGFPQDGQACEGTHSVQSLFGRYYNLQISIPKYVGGHFWWYGQEDLTRCPSFYNAFQEYVAAP